MQPQILFFSSIALALVAWGIIAMRFVWPKLKMLPRAEALRPLLVLHSFRFIGLAFLVPGVVSADLPLSFARSAAYGDLAALALALLTLALLPSRVGIVTAWIFNLWGSADILNAFYQAQHAGLIPGELGAAYFIPTFIVPLLLVTHGLGFGILFQNEESAVSASSPVRSVNVNSFL